MRATCQPVSLIGTPKSFQAKFIPFFSGESCYRGRDQAHCRQERALRAQPQTLVPRPRGLSSLMAVKHSDAAKP
jgi:hypothetical protein